MAPDPTPGTDLERLQLDEALRESEARYRAVVEDQTEFIVRWLPDGTRTFVNEAYARYFGQSSDEMVGANFFPLIETDEGREAVRARIRSLTPARPVMTNVHRARRFDGQWRWQEWNDRGLFDGQGTLVALQSVGRDVHERVEAERQLRESETRFRAIFDQTFQFTSLLRADGVVLESNRTALEFAGIHEEDVLGKPFWDTPWWSHSEPLRRQLKDAVARAAAGELVRLEVTHRRPDGTLHAIDFSLKPVRDESGEVTLLISEGRDVHDRKQLEEQLRQSQKMEAIGLLAGGVAHDFNNLLTVISGYGDLLRLEMENPTPPVTEAIDAIRDAGQRAALLTRQLLAFSRRQMLEPTVLDLNEVVRGSEHLRRLIGEHIILDTSLDPGIDRVRVDRTQFEQVILNLALNARDAMPDGGRLTITTRNLTPGPGERRDPEAGTGRFVVLTVADTGCGMSELVKERIFEPFFTTKDPGKGTGLGLSTVYGIVAQSDGRIEVESAVGVGTTFRVLLPAVVDRPPAPGRASIRTASIGGAETVLLVEDEAMVGQVARAALGRHGYTVLEARGGREALALAAGHRGPIDILVTDLVMPELNGRELAERLRAERPAIKVLYVSGYTEDTVVRHGVAEGTDSFLPKPFTPEVLARKVREVLTGGG